MLCLKHESNPDQTAAMTCDECICDDCNEPLYDCSCNDVPDEETYGDGCSCPCPYCGRDHHFTGDPLGDYERTNVTCEYCDKVFEIQNRISNTFHGFPK